MERQSRGQEIAAISGAIRHSPNKGIGWFRVRSSTGRRWYEVNIVKPSCTCPDFSSKCKHIYAAELFAARVPRPKNLGQPTFTDIEREVNELLQTVETDLSGARGLSGSWRVHEEIGDDLALFRTDRRTLKRRMREFRKTMVATDHAMKQALQIIARHICSRDMMEDVAQMALDGYSADQIKGYVETGVPPTRDRQVD